MQMVPFCAQQYDVVGKWSKADFTTQHSFFDFQTDNVAEPSPVNRFISLPIIVVDHGEGRL